MQLVITSSHGKTSATLNGVALEGLLAFELTAEGAGKTEFSSTTPNT
ncbi:MAG: hypothetical protein SOY94_01170 [Candidatus Limiplasma sp.]|nr:hypothetical protein [Candidatus Limiplasma sp.]